MPIDTSDLTQLQARCLPFLRGQAQPATAAELMASRYVAYSLAEIDYILDTHDPDTREETDRDATEEWAKAAKFHGLTILQTVGGEAGDDTGEVEFKALYTAQDGEHVHHERASFVRKDGRWYFAQAREIRTPLRREAPKVGRNDPCPCGSGKKHKRCHGARGA